MKLAKKFEISTGHRLSDYDGKCKYLHGHNYIGELIIQSDKLDERGMLMDFVDMKALIKIQIEEKLDHKTLLNKNDPENIIEFGGDDHFDWFKESIVWVDYNPTVENMIEHIKQQIELLLPGVKIAIHLSETSNSYAQTD